MDDGRLVDVLKALADPNRFRMLQEIAAAGELSCGQVGDRFRLAQPTVSHHLKILADAGVIQVRREAQHAYMSLAQELLDEVGAFLSERLVTQRARRPPGTTRSAPTRRRPR